MRPLLLLPLVFGVAIAPASAHAYTYQSLVSDGCHERLAVTALRSVRKSLPANAPSVAPNADDTALIHDIPFDLDADVRDLSGASLTIGVRDNDLHGNGPNELDSLAQIHGNPANQREHCLRSATEDEPNGTLQALEDCKGFIREKVNAALDGLDANGVPDPNKRTSFEVSLQFRKKTTVSLPAFWVEIGRALHTLEDSFTHNFRDPADHHKVTVTENYDDFVNSTIVESRDGPAHRAEMDKCVGIDDFRKTNFDLATQASIDLLHLALDPALTRDAKTAALETIFTTYLPYETGCTAANRWCNAKENDYLIGAGCTISRSNAMNWFAFGAMSLGCAGLFARRRSRRRLATAVSALALLAVPTTARADDPPAPPAQPTPEKATVVNTPDVDPKKAPEGVLTKEEVKNEKKNEAKAAAPWAIFVGGTGSISNPSLNGQLGIRYALSERWQIGLDGELNNWYGSTTHRFVTGAFNGYGTVVFRTPLRFAGFNIRSTANLGTSVLLVDLYGAPKGSTGIFLGLAPLGLEYKLSSRIFLVISGLSIAVPIPKLTGAPFAYSQYRESIGLEIAL